MINVDGVEYRNLEEQVQFLTDQYNGLDETFASKEVVKNIASVLNDQQAQISSANQQIANVNQQVQTVDGKFASYVPIEGTQTLDAKIFKTEIALQSPEGEITRLKNINNNITMTNGNGVNIFNIDEQLQTMTIFGKTLATLEDIATGQGTKVTVGGQVQSTWDADSTVKTTGDQSISGIKTFNSNIALANTKSIIAKLSTGEETPILNISASNNMTLGGNGIGYIASYNNLQPSGNNNKTISLGGSNAFWRDIYLSGNLKDDNSNSISIAQIANKSQITTESTARQQADANLQSQITTESTARQQEDADLQSQINNISNQLSTESTSRSNADILLQSQITDNANNITTLNSRHLYSHNVKFGKSATGFVTSTILTSSSTPFTFSTLASWLYSNGFTDSGTSVETNANRHFCTGAGSNAYIQNMSSANGTSIRLYFNPYTQGVAELTSATTFVDKVITLI